MNKLSIIGIFILFFVFSACKKDKNSMPTPTDKTFKSTVIPSNVNDLFESRGNANSDTVWVYVQGGPTIVQDYVFEEKSANGSDLFPFITDDLRVYPYQVQQINDQIGSFENFTFEQAKIESTKNAEIVKKVVEHLENQNKVVYIIGHSYGSFVVNEVLAKYGRIGRKIASLNGRLDMDEVVWKGFSNGEEWLFDAMGENPSRNVNADNSILEQNMRKMAAGLGFNRYTSALAMADLSDAIFLMAENDEFVGDFTQEAIEFLNANAEAMLSLQDLGHSDVFNPEIFKILHDDYFLKEPIVISGIERFGIFTVLDDESSVIMNGEIGNNTLSNFNEMIAKYPNINLINILQVPGSLNDDINLQVSLLVHQNDIATHLMDDGLIASGGVDFFLAGTKRTMGNNTQIGVHSWGGEDANGNMVTATDFAVGHEYHQPYIDYYVSVGFSKADAEAFYYFTINAAPFDSVHYMTTEEIEQYKILAD